MFVALDFDGTVVAHEFPDIGKDIGAIPWLLKAQAAGAQFILFTMRSEKYLEEAVRFLGDAGIVLYGVNVNPTQHQWTSSPKAYAQLYIDDAALGTPLTTRYDINRRFVDWSVVGPMLIEHLTGDSNG